ncbi:hypothetical protein THRCLA_01889, partial [Thraustotheca clavata]
MTREELPTEGIPSVGDERKKKRKTKLRAQTVEEVFSSVSTLKANGINPPPEKIVLTPRSAEACLRTGVNPETLKIRDLESFENAGVSPAVQKMRHEAYSMRRHDQMKLVRAEKKKILSEEDENEQAQSSRSASISPKKPSPDKSSMIDIEKRRLEKVQFRQQREIEQMLEFEMKMNRLQEEAAEKVLREKKLHEQAEQEKQQRIKELAESKRLKEIQKKAQDDAAEERRRQVAAQMFQRDKELAEQKARQERLRKIEAKLREEERQKKTEEHKQKTESILAKQQEEIQTRLHELTVAEETRKKMLEEQQELRMKEMEERREIVATRINNNLKQARRVEKQRKREIKMKQRQSELLRAQVKAEQERQREIARQEVELMERKRQMVLEEARREEGRKKECLLEKQKEIEQNVQSVQEAHLRSLQLKREQRIIQKQLKLSNVDRMKRIQEYKRLETLRKIREAEERTESMLQQKVDLIRQRKEASVRSKIQRDAIVQTMENVKVTKKWKKASKTIDKVLGVKDKTKKSRPQSSDGTTMTRSQSVAELPQLRSKTPPQVSANIRPASPPPTKTAFKHIKDDERSIEPSPFRSPYDEVPNLIQRKHSGLKKSKHTASSIQTTNCVTDCLPQTMLMNLALSMCVWLLAYSHADDQTHAIEDIDRDGFMGTQELSDLRAKLQHAFDVDNSGRLEKDEMRTVLEVEHVSREFNQLDSNADSYISVAELESRWDELGSEMTVEEVADWIAYSVQLPQYQEIFRNHFVSGYTFPLLMDKNGDRLKDLGVDSPLHRHQIALMMKRKIAGVGKVPLDPIDAKCRVSQKPSRAPKFKLEWKPADERSSPSYQVQVQKNNAEIATEFDDFRITTWSAYGRSGRVEIECPPVPTSNPVVARSLPTVTENDENMTIFEILKSYLWWLDEVILMGALIFFPLRAYIYGDVNFLLRVFRRLPPHSPTRVVVEVEHEDPMNPSFTEARVRVSWDKPIDNGVRIVCYCVRYTDERDNHQYLKMTALPLPTSCRLSPLRYGETYKFVVEATNEFGLVSRSSQSTYMVSPPVRTIPHAIDKKRSQVLRNQCYLCADPTMPKVPTLEYFDSLILHFCCKCDREFCHAHRRHTNHSRAMSCPAVN